MAESCKKSLEVLRLAQSRGLPPPKHRFEERSFNTVRWEFTGTFYLFLQRQVSASPQTLPV